MNEAQNHAAGLLTGDRQSLMTGRCELHLRLRTLKWGSLGVALILAACSLDSGGLSASTGGGASDGSSGAREAGANDGGRSGGLDAGATDAGEAGGSGGNDAGVGGGGAEIDGSTGADSGASGGASGGGGVIGEGGSGGAGPAEPPYAPVYRIAVRVHRGESDLSDSELEGVLLELNHIWWSQAGICFEVDVVSHNQPLSTGFDIWFVDNDSEYADGVEPDGKYYGAHAIIILDWPPLASANPAVAYPAARSAAHSLGHGLSLLDQPCADCDGLLMRPEAKGYQLLAGPPASANEHQAARQAAAGLALKDTTQLHCAPPNVDVDD